MPQKSLSTARLAGLKLANPLMNAAYIASKTKEDAKILAQSPSSAVVVGSITLKSRKANRNKGFWMHRENLYSLNSFGMPNGGHAYFKNNLPEIAKIAHGNNKPLIANVAGFSPEEFAQLTRLAVESNADMVELNLGCPNAYDGGKQKRIISYHPKLVEEVLTAIKPLDLSSAKVCVKISPLPPDILSEVAKVIIEAKCVHAVTATNSYPNASFTTGTGKPDDILPGMAGRALKPISIGVVKQLRAILPREIDIIGCGGVSSSQDAIDYLDAGASAVQIATALTDEGPLVFNRILSQRT